MLSPRWLLLGSLAGLLVVFGLGYEFFNPWLRFDRVAISSGEWWRILTCHLVHLNEYHLALNITGFGLFAWFFADVMTFRIWCLAIATHLLSVGVALYLLNPDLYRYVGLSGVLHGWFVCGLLLGFRDTPWLNSIVLLLLGWRIWSEHQPGYDVNYLRDYIQGSVFVDAHLYGATTGLALGLLILSFRAWQRREARL